MLATNGIGHRDSAHVELLERLLRGDLIVVDEDSNSRVAGATVSVPSLPAQRPGLQLEYLPAAMPACGDKSDGAFYDELEHDYQKYTGQARDAIVEQRPLDDTGEASAHTTLSLFQLSPLLVLSSHDLWRSSAPTHTASM